MTSRKKRKRRRAETMTPTAVVQEPTQRLCTICKEPLPESMVANTAHFLCRRPVTKDDAWYRAENIRKRREQARKIREERYNAMVTAKWEARQRGTAPGRIKMRALNQGVVGHIHAQRNHAGSVGSLVLHCYLCQDYYPPEQFYGDKSRTSGRSSACISCTKIRDSWRGR